MENIASAKIEKFFAKYPSSFVDKGEILIHGYREQKSIHYLVSGRVKQYDIDSQGEEIIINTFGPADLFPIFWMNSKDIKYYFFETTLPSQLRSAPFSDVIEFVINNSEVVYELMGRLCSDFNEIQQRITCLLKGNARKRTVFEILTECRRFGKRLKKDMWFVGLHEDELAKQAGLSRETINREIAKLKRLKLISITHKGLVINNMKNLQTIFDESL